jgi:hypothetical protein
MVADVVLHRWGKSLMGGGAVRGCGVIVIGVAGGSFVQDAALLCWQGVSVDLQHDHMHEGRSKWYV